MTEPEATDPTPREDVAAAPNPPQPELPRDEVVTGPDPSEAEPAEPAPAQPVSLEPAAAPATSPAAEDERWFRASRAILLFGLIAMAFVTWLRLSRASFTTEFLKDNTLDLHTRDVFLAQILGAGVLAGLVTLLVLLFWAKSVRATRQAESWAWFASPLILLPAIPVVLEVDVWRGKHQDFLPVVLFLAILTEFFVSRAWSSVPDFFKGDLPWSFQPRAALTRVHDWIAKNGLLVVIVLAALGYGAFMGFYTVRWHRLLGTATFDLGINVNLVHGGLYGKFNQSTVLFPDDPQAYIANHVKLGLYLFLPIYALYPHPETLLVIQSVSLGLGAIPLFLLARRHVPEWIACVLSLAYLANYTLHGANFYEMKEVPTGAVFVFLMMLFIDTKRWVWASIFFFFSALMREDMPVPLAVLGLWLLLSGYRPRFGAAMAGISIFWFVLLRFKIMMDAGSWWFPNMYEDLFSEGEKGFRSVMKTLVSNPTFVLEHVFVPKKFWYMMHLLVPLAFLPVRRWYLWAALVPGAILTLLVTDYDPPIMFSFQYVMFWLPYLFMAAILALKVLGEGPAGTAARRAGAAVAVAVATAALSYNYGAFPAREGSFQSGYHKIRFGWDEEDEEQYLAVRAMVAAIPREASVTTTEHIGAHLANRVGFYTLRRGTHDADYMIARQSELKLNATARSVKEALRKGTYGVVGRYGDYVLFKRGADASQNGAILKEWRLGAGAKKKSKVRQETEEKEEILVEGESDKDEREGGEAEDTPLGKSSRAEAEPDGP